MMKETNATKGKVIAIGRKTTFSPSRGSKLKSVMIRRRTATQRKFTWNHLMCPQRMAREMLPRPSTESAAGGDSVAHSARKNGLPREPDLLRLEPDRDARILQDYIKSMVRRTM